MSIRSKSKAYFIQASNLFDISSNFKMIREYVGCFKYALLFTKKIIIADNMIVNSPNFRMAYRIDDSFREIICNDFVEVAHFDKYKLGRHFTLQELRQFYKYHEEEHHLFNQNLSPEFRNYLHDDDLIEIERSTKQIYPKASLRDPLFSSLIVREAKSDSVKKIFGDRYSAFNDAFEILTSRIEGIAPFGHIMLDWNPNENDETNIYNIMARLPYFRNRSVNSEKIYRQFGVNLSRLSRSLFFDTESYLLKGHPFIPAELKDFNNRFFNSDNKYREKLHNEKIKIDLKDLDYGCLAELTRNDIAEIRKHGSSYFHNVSSFAKESDIHDLKKSVDDYLGYIRKYVIDKSIYLPLKNRQSKISEITSYLVKDQDMREIGVSFVCKLLASSPMTIMNYVSLIAPTAAKISLQKYSMYIEKTSSKKSLENNRRIRDIEASIIIDTDRSFLKQFD